VFCNLGTSKTVTLKFITTVNIVTPYFSPCNSDHPNLVPVGQKSVEQKKMVEDKYVLIPSTTACYLTIVGYGFFWGGHLRVPSRRCDLVVPADWGWGHSNKTVEIVIEADMAARHLSRKDNTLAGAPTSIIHLPAHYLQ